MPIDGTEEVSTENTILNDIGEGNEQTTVESTDPKDTGTTTNDPTAPLTTSSEQSTPTSVDGKPVQQQARGPEDLKDSNGNVIAKGGSERRLYEAAHREKGRAEGLSRKVEELTGQLAAINEAGNVGTQFGLTPTEVTTGAQLMQAWKKNPVETIQYLLTQAQASGHNIDAIAQSGGIDAGAMQQMLKDTLAPLLSEQQGRVDTQEANTKALEIYNDFSGKHPNAKIHEDSISRLMQQDNSLSPEAAYFKLQSYYLERGLDWTKNLDTLKKEHLASNGSSVNTQSPQPPNGNNVNPDTVTNSANVAEVETSYEDIIKSAMNDSGIKI
jgi:hypothetical protein